MNPYAFTEDVPINATVYRERPEGGLRHFDVWESPWSTPWSAASSATTSPPSPSARHCP